MESTTVEYPYVYCHIVFQVLSTVHMRIHVDRAHELQYMGSLVKE